MKLNDKHNNWQTGFPKIDKPGASNQMAIKRVVIGKL